MQKFLKFQEALELLNSLDWDKNVVEITVLSSDASEPIEENEGNASDLNIFCQYHFGYKLWALNGRDGWCYNFSLNSIKNLVQIRIIFLL